MIVAGPGTGKTRTLTHRIAAEIARPGAAGRSALAITFTRRAAEEMRTRLAAMLRAAGSPPRGSPPQGNRTHGSPPRGSPPHPTSRSPPSTGWA